MTLREWIKMAEVDEQALMEYTLHNERLTRTVLGMFPQDAGYARLTEAMRARDQRAVRGAAHALKGVAASLGFQALFALSKALVEAVDAGENARFDDLFARIGSERERLLACIACLPQANTPDEAP